MKFIDLLRSQQIVQRDNFLHLSPYQDKFSHKRDPPVFLVAD